MKNLTKAMVFLLSVIFTGYLIESAGIDASQANILNYSNYSMPVFIIFGICLAGAYNTLLHVVKRFHEYFS